MKQTLKYIADYGFMTAFSGLSLGLIYKYFSNKMKDGQNSSPKADWRGHHFFAKSNQLINVDLKSLPIDDPIKREIFTRLLTIKITVIKEKVRDFLSSDSSLTMSDADFNSKALELVYSSINEYEKLFRVYYSPSIANYVINKFSEWHEPHITMTAEVLENVLNSKYNSREGKICNMLSILCLGLITTVTDAEKSINSINGTLAKMVREEVDGEL